MDCRHPHSDAYIIDAGVAENSITETSDALKTALNAINRSMDPSLVVNVWVLDVDRTGRRPKLS